MVDYFLFTDAGERESNEDYIGMKEKAGQYCFILADGLGGHGKGEVASKSVVETGLDFFESNRDALSWQEDIFPYCAKNLIQLQKQMNNTSGMKTTMVLLKIDTNEKTAQYVHVGDSRGYYFNKGKYKSRTNDHSVPQMLYKSGEIKESEIRHHPDRNRVLRVLGIEWDEPQQEASSPVKIFTKDKQAFLMCTDGFWDWITEKEMEECLNASDSSKEWIDSMIKIVRQNGSGNNMDNFSAIAVIVCNDESGLRKQSLFRKIADKIGL